MTKTIEALNDRLFDVITDMDDYELVSLYNVYCDNAGYCDDRIYDMDEFDEIMGGYSATDLAQRVAFGDFNPNDRFFMFNGYGNLVSKNYLTDEISVLDIVEHIIETEDCLYNDDIQEVFDEWEEWVECEDEEEGE